MSFRQLWELGEIYTAPLNIFLVLMGVSFAGDEYGVFWNWRLALYLGTILLFHVATNIFNNYMDYRNASDDHDYKVNSNIIGREQLSLKEVRWAFWLFLISSSILGLLLVVTTNWLLLLIGLLGYYIGLFYSYGPRPLNSLPIAETVTSLASGVLVPFVAAFVLSYGQGAFSGATFGRLFLVCLPLAGMMFNNLLANNTCDIEEDIVNGRRTLVYYIGKQRAVRLLFVVFLGSNVMLAVLVWLSLAPWPVLLTWLFLPRSWSLLKGYRSEQDKDKTFPIVLKRMAILMTLYPLFYFMGNLWL